MKTASVVELKTHLGRYLGLVTQGETVVVTSHRRPVACLVRPPAGADDVPMVRPERQVAELDGIIPVRLPRSVDGVRELMSDREGR